MDVAIIAIFIPIIAILGIIVIVVYLRKYENQERMSMIDKGMSPSDFKREPSNSSWPLRFALLLIGAGTGLMMGYLLDAYSRMDDVAYFSMIFVFGGIGLGCAYLIEEKKRKQQG